MPVTMGFHHRTLRELDGYIIMVTGFMWRRMLRGDPALPYQAELLAELHAARVKHYNRDPNEKIEPAASAFQAPSQVDQFLSSPAARARS